MRRFNPAVLFLLILCGRLAAQTQPQPLPSNIKAQVDKIFEKWNKSDSPGCALGVYRDGQIIYKHGYGMANLNDDVPITPATVFHARTMSNWITSDSPTTQPVCGHPVKCSRVQSDLFRTPLKEVEQRHERLMQLGFIGTGEIASSVVTGLSSPGVTALYLVGPSQFCYR